MESGSQIISVRTNTTHIVDDIETIDNKKIGFHNRYEMFSY